MLKPSPEAELRALDLFERLMAYPGNASFRDRLLKREGAETLACLARLEGGHASRAAMPTETPAWLTTPFAAPPARIGPFRLTERIGRGGMGDVWRGDRDDGLFEQTVAIKLIHGHLSDAAASAFEAERRILAKLDHPDIVRLTDGGVTDEGLHYLIMDHVDGAPFDEAAAGLALKQRVRLFRQAAATVQFAHSRLIAHADLKPSNILVDGEGRVRLLDFGIAALLSGDGGPGPATGAMTPDFVSPQRLAGGPPSVADDIFALGCLLGLIVGQDADPDLRAITAKASAAEETGRYETVAALSADLARWETGFPVTAQRDSLAYRARKFCTRNRVLTTVATFAVLALITTSVVASFASVRADRARADAERAQAEATSRFEDVRGTARYLLFTLMDRLEARPNTLALRKEVADVAGHYLDRLSKGSGATPELRLEAARGLIRLAEAQGVPGYPNLDQPAAAKQSLDRALALLEPDRSADAAVLVVTALTEQARVSSYMSNASDLALQLLTRAQAVADAHPDIPVRIRARMLAERADVLNWVEDYDGAARLAQSTLRGLPPAADPEMILVRAHLTDILSFATYYRDNPGAALAPYREEVAQLEAAQRLFPASRSIQRTLAKARWQLGSTLLSIKRKDEALTLLAATTRDLRAMTAFDADDQETARLMEHVDLDYGQALADLGRYDEARPILEANMAFRRRQWAEHPGEVRRLRDLVVSLSAFGLIQAQHGQVRDGCETFAEFRRLTVQMAKISDLKAMYMTSTLNDVARYEAKYCAGPARKKSF